jgi:hypothetical protein
MQGVKAGVLYFALTFAAGFILGTIRVLWAVPRVGVRMAELAEAPVMVAVSFFAASWLVRRLRNPREFTGRGAMGLIGLALLLLAEFGLVLALRGITVRQYLASRDPVSGTVYAISLVAFAIMPLLVQRH